MARHGPQIALVQDGVGVLLRIDHPDDGVDEGEDPVDLLAVFHGRRIVVGQVHQDQPAQLGVAVGPLDGTSAQSSGNAQPVDERRRAVAPTAHERRGGGGAAHPGLRDRDPGERVEQRRLATAGRPGQGDDRVLPGEPAARRRLLQDPARLGQRAAVQPGARQSDEFPERVETRAQAAVVGEGRGPPCGAAPGLHGGRRLLGGVLLVHPPRDQPVVPGVVALAVLRRGGRAPFPDSVLRRWTAPLANAVNTVRVVRVVSLACTGAGRRRGCGRAPLGCRRTATRPGGLRRPADVGLGTLERHVRARVPGGLSPPTVPARDGIAVHTALLAVLDGTLLDAFTAAPFVPAAAVPAAVAFPVTRHAGSPLFPRPSRSPFCLLRPLRFPRSRRLRHVRRCPGVVPRGARRGLPPRPALAGPALRAVRTPGPAGPAGLPLPSGPLGGVVRAVSDGGHPGHLSFCSRDSAAMSSAWGSAWTSRPSSGASRRSRSVCSTRST
nr:hypothetical protein [Streptomyces sp. MH191]